MSGHIRFSSFQGSRERTPPISLAQELGVLLDLDEFASWRAQHGGGILMSRCPWRPGCAPLLRPATAGVSRGGVLHWTHLLRATICSTLPTFR